MASSTMVPRQSISRVILLLSLIILPARANYVRHFNDASMELLTPGNRTICHDTLDDASVPAKHRCAVFATCILNNLDDYALAGANSGTTLLALIPPALAVFAAGRLQEHSLLDSGLLKRLRAEDVSQRLEAAILLLVAAFAGTYSPGLALWKIAQALSEQEAVPSCLHTTGQVEKNYNPETLRDVYLPDKYFKTWPSRIPIYVMLTATTALTVYIWCVMGFRTVVTWACNYDILIVIWALCRAAPLLFESSILLLIGRQLERNKAIPMAHSSQLRKSPQTSQSEQHTQDVATVQTATKYKLSSVISACTKHSDVCGCAALCISTAGIRLISAAHLIARILDFGLTLLGTGILGSAILMDGGTALYYLLGIPMLYGTLSVCCGLLEQVDR